MDERLKPCPFCDGKPLINSMSYGALRLKRVYWISCSVCGTRTQRNEKSTVIKKWNRRVDDDSVV